MWVETQKHNEEVQPQVEKTKTLSEVKKWIEQKSEKIAKTPIWKKVWETIKLEVWADKAWEKLKWILHWIETNESKENIFENKSRREILKRLDWKIKKTLPEWQSIDKIAKILKRPDWTEFKNIDEAKDFLREQFLKWEIKDLNKPLINNSGEVLKDRYWNDITIFSKTLEKNPILWDINKENPKLAKEIISLYWEKVLDSYQDVLNDLFKKWKLPKTLDEFSSILKEYAVKNSINTDELSKTIKSMFDNWVINKQEAQSMVSWISSAEARNIQAESLPDLENLSWEQKTLALIKHFEWFSSNAFWDYKQWTHWYWTKAEWPWDTITKEWATKELKNKVNKEFNLNNYISSEVMNKLWDNQKAALTSFIFNLWPGKLSSFQWLLSKYPDTADQIATKMQRYNKAGWNILKWLVSRRKTEAKLFLTEDENKANDKKVEV